MPTKSDTPLQPRVVYLSSTATGVTLLDWLRSQPCNVVLAETGNRRSTTFPEYDLGFGFLYTHRIPKSEFNRPYRWINFHPGPLPEMRGRNLAYHAIMEGREQFGASVHYMDEEFDTGKVIEVLRFPIEPHHTAGDLVNLAHDHLAVLFKKYVPLALRGMVPSRNQDAGVYYKKEPINNEVVLTDKQKRLVRALTVSPKFYPKVLIGGRNYRIIPEIK